MKHLRAALAGILAAGAAAATWHLSAAETVLVQPAEVSSDLVTSCVNCHNGNWAEYNEKNQSNQYFKTNEGSLWKAHDPHVRAYEVLQYDIGKRMAKMMKLDTANGKITDSRCLSCHAVDVKLLPPDMRADQGKKAYVAEDDVGIGCVLCHTDNHSDRWVTAHTRVASWREKKADAKHEMGLKNLRDPLVKAELCASCHVGSVKEGKVVTHEMYAAGHPPLPPLELMGFVEHQPMHFMLPEQIKAERPIHERKYDHYRAEHVAIGAIVALKAEADLLADDAAKASEKHTLIDYARFDCYACHHDLKHDGGRQERGYKGPPGRPPLKAWNAALASTVVKFASALPSAAGFEPAHKALETAIFAQPFGDAGKVKTAAAALSAWCGTFLKSLDGSGLFRDPNSVAAFGEKLREAALSKEYSADPEAVMALLWAYRALGHDQAADWKAIDAQLPSTVRTLLDPKGTKPVTAGIAFEMRQKVFNDYNRLKFKTVFDPKR